MARILHVCASPDFAQYVDRILPALAKAGHEVHFVSAPGEDPQRLLEGSRIHVHSIPIERKIDLPADVRSLHRFTALLRKIKPDLVHAHTPKGGLLGMVGASIAGVGARIYQMHGLRYETASGAKRRLLMGCERIAVGAAHRVICVSPSVKARAVEDGIVSAKKAVVFGNGSAQGIDISEYDPRVWSGAAKEIRKRLGIPAGSQSVLYLGRLAADKGLIDLAQAWQQVAAHRPEARLILAGNEDPTDPVNLTRFESLPQVHFLPHQEDPRPLLALADVVTLPSYREGLPQAILEAGAMKKPVVAARVTGVIDALVDGKSGLLVPPRDSPALARVLLELLDDAGRRREMGEFGREYMSARFQFEPILQETLALYGSLLGSGSGAKDRALY